ncbi:MAG: isocitrate lyase/PEP mutase family protein [Rhodocyclales bacterium]|nr:isocitrate lyase/PEP mutase family protein [Rhodocyclales bacterium]
MHPSQQLRALLATGTTLVMPDAYDPLSARIIMESGYAAVQCSGYSFARAAACPSEAEFGFERNLRLTADIVRAVSVPVMADGEDGFGGPEVVYRSVRAYIDAGAAGMNLEDQVLDVPDSGRVVTRDLALAKLAAALAATRDADLPAFLINARTDALAVASDKQAGLREAIERANAYLEAGAGLAFVTGVTSLAQVRVLVAAIDGPLSIAAGMATNADAFSIADLVACGVARVSLPTLPLYAALDGLRGALARVARANTFDALPRAVLSGSCSPAPAKEA